MYYYYKSIITIIMINYECNYSYLFIHSCIYLFVYFNLFISQTAGRNTKMHTKLTLRPQEVKEYPSHSVWLMFKETSGI